jgi:hypothetical protein
MSTIDIALILNTSVPSHELIDRFLMLFGIDTENFERSIVSRLMRLSFKASTP